MKNLILLSLLLTLFISCNEEVSEDLQETPDEVVIDPIFQEIRVVSTMDQDLSHTIHSMGSLSSACSLLPPASGLRAEDYSKADLVRNVDCVMDVEELDLHFHGASFEVQVDNRMCEYLEYQPYRYFKHQPGKTERTIFKTICDDACGAARPEECDRYYDQTTAATSGNYSLSLFTNDLTSEFEDSNKPLCTFNYNVDTGNDNDIEALCDIGQVNVESYLIEGYYYESCEGAPGNDQTACETNGGSWVGATYCEGDGEPTAATAGSSITYLRSPDDDEEDECGGELKACLAGAGVEEGTDADPFTLFYSEDLDYVEEFRISPPIELNDSREFNSNLHIANFSRVCADTSTNKNTPSIFDSLTYSGVENERISYNFSITDVDVNGDGILDSKVYADHPFKGTVYGDSINGNRYSTSPYYAIRCLDRARDVKAQIRLHIREWDRSFEENNIYLARVSDKSNEASGLSRMDNNGVYDTDINWNDYADWDDFFDSVANPIFVDNMCSTLVNEPSTDVNHGKDNFPGI